MPAKSNNHGIKETIEKNKEDNTEPSQENVEREPSTSGEPCAKKKRRQYDFLFKMNFLDQIENGNALADVELCNRIDKSLVTRWLNKKKEIFDGASSQDRLLDRKG